MSATIYNIVHLHCKLCNKILQTGKWPTHWTRSILVAIPKISGTTDCTEHRTIALISHARRYYYESCSNTHRGQQTNSMQRNKWVSARRQERETRFSTSENPTEKAREFNVPLYMAFIDYKKGFDSVRHSTLSSVLKRMGVNGTVVSLMKNYTVVRKQQSE